VPLVPVTTIIDSAKKAGNAVGSFNVFNIDTARAVLDAAEQEHAPVILAFAAVHEPYTDFESLSLSLVSLAQRASVPVGLHLDHSETLELATRAIRCGFTSVMFDGFGLSPEEKKRQTRSVVDIAHSVGIPVEAEFGHITKIGQDADRRDELLINAHDVADFVTETGIDIVAAAVGSVHGLSAGEAELDLELLDEVITTVPCYVSLHGGSGMSDEDIRATSAAGVMKFSYFSGLSAAAVSTARAVLDADAEVGIADLTAAMMRSFTEKARDRIRLFATVVR
jgi:ketose-bisphosphate aldolase